MFFCEKKCKDFSSPEKKEHLVFSFFLASGYVNPSMGGLVYVQPFKGWFDSTFNPSRVALFYAQPVRGRSGALVAPRAP